MFVCTYVCMCVCVYVGSLNSGLVLQGPSVIYSTDLVQFNCSLVGGASNTYQWTRNSQLLPGGSDGALLVSVPLEWAGSCLVCEVVETGDNASQTLQVVGKWLPSPDARGCHGDDRGSLKSTNYRDPSS